MDSVKTPTPSLYSPRSITATPRTFRKEGYGKPIMPGYKPTSMNRHKDSTFFIHRTIEVQHVSKETNLRDSIPIMSKPIAICCAVLNVICPGLGKKIYYFHTQTENTTGDSE